MTNEEAREVINREIDKAIDDETYMTDEIYDALCVASKSIALQILESQPCEDVISRKAVLDLATTIETDDYSGNETLEVVEVEAIKNLPSVTPSYNSIKTELKPCEDCISRKSVVEWLERCTDDSIEHAIDSNLDFIPSVTPQPKVGRWIYDGDCIICNKCLKAFGWISMNMASDFCPNCGAKMEATYKEMYENGIDVNKNLCDSCITKGCMFQSGIVRNHCDFYKAESEDKDDVAKD